MTYTAYFPTIPIFNSYCQQLYVHYYLLIIVIILINVFLKGNRQF